MATRDDHEQHFIALKALLCERIGLDSASLGDAVLLHAFRQTCQICKLPDLQSLHHACLIDPKIRDELYVQVSVPESWFFRAEPQFDDLAQHARMRWRDRTRIRILSLPCAGGEEIYSIGMRLLDCGFAPTQLDLVGVDLSAACIERAKHGRYRNSALRGQTLHPLMRRINTGEFEIADTLKAITQFLTANVLNLQAHTLGQFDAIFLRNLLIYLTDAARKHVLDLVCQICPAGTPVFAGHAEPLTQFHPGFSRLAGASSSLSFATLASSGLPRAFDKATPSIWSTSDTPQAAPSLPSLIDKSAKTQTTIDMKITDVAERTSPLLAVAADQAQQLMRQIETALDAGDPVAARALMSDLVKLPRAPAQAYYLLGMLRLSEGELDAADQAFAQCLYLSHEHLDALQQRLLIAQRQNNPAATTLKARLERLRKQGMP